MIWLGGNMIVIYTSVNVGQDPIIITSLLYGAEENTLIGDIFWCHHRSCSLPGRLFILKHSSIICPVFSDISCLRANYGSNHFKLLLHDHHICWIIFVTASSHGLQVGGSYRCLHAMLQWWWWWRKWHFTGDIPISHQTPYIPTKQVQLTSEGSWSLW